MKCGDFAVILASLFSHARARGAKFMIGTNLSKQRRRREGALQPYTHADARMHKCTQPSTLCMRAVKLLTSRIKGAIYVARSTSGHGMGWPDTTDRTTAVSPGRGPNSGDSSESTSSAESSSVAPIPFICSYLAPVKRPRNGPIFMRPPQKDSII